MKKLFLITASLTPFASFALAPMADSIKSEVAPVSLPKKTVAQCEDVYMGKIWDAVSKVNTAQEAGEVAAQLWQELQDCKKAAEGVAVEIQSPEAQVENK